MLQNTTPVSVGGATALQDQPGRPAAWLIAERAQPTREKACEVPAESVQSPQHALSRDAGFQAQRQVLRLFLEGPLSPEHPSQAVPRDSKWQGTWNSPSGVRLETGGHPTSFLTALCESGQEALVPRLQHTGHDRASLQS